MIPPQKYLIIETNTIKLSPDDIDKAVSSSVERTQSHSKGFVASMQKIPFFRALYHQIDGGLLDLFLPSNNESSSENDGDNQDSSNTQQKTIEIDHDAYAKLFSYLREMEEKYDTQIIILYHPTEQFADDGSIYFFKEEYRKPFTDYAKEYDITYLDMTDSFVNMYYKENHVAHGFCTGLIGTGHLNKYGHKAVADELYNQILLLEEDNNLCL